MAGKKSKGKGKAAIPNWKKKKWYELVSPASFGEKAVGESLIEDPQDLKGKVVEVNLMNLTDNPRKQSISMKLRVQRVNDNKGFTKPIEIKILPAYIKRLVKTGKDRVDLSFTAETKDGVLLRLKPLIVTKSNVSRSIRTDIRAKALEVLTNYCAENGYETVFSETARNNLQKELKKALDKVYPVRLVEIRMIEVELQKGIRHLPEDAAEEPVEEETVEEKPAKKTTETKVEEIEEEVVEKKPEEDPSEEEPEDEKEE